MNRAWSLWRQLGLAGVMAFALIVAWDAPSSRAEVPDHAVAPSPTYAPEPDSTASDPVLYALAPDSSSTPATTPAKASDPDPSSLAPEGEVGAPAAGSEPEAATPPAAAADLAATPKSDAPAAPKAEAHVAPKPAAGSGKKAKAAPGVAKNSKQTISASKPPGTPGPGHPDEGARVRAELERTEPVLRTVKAKVVRSFNKKAREEFEVVTTRQREAREALGENLYARAERLTLEARSLAREIAVHLGPPEDDPDYVSMTLDRTDDALGRAREVLRDAGEGAERRRLDALERRQKEARQLYKDGATRRAYASTREVRDGVLTLLRDCDDLPVREETAEKALKRASRSLEQAKGELGERLTTAAARLAREARAQMAKAKAAFARKNYRDTLLHSKLVERNLELAVSAQRSATNRSG